MPFDCEKGVVWLDGISDIKEKLKTMLSYDRYMHSLRVTKQAVILARRFRADACKAEIAGLLHDCARDLSLGEALNAAAKFDIILDNITINSPGIIHAVIGEAVARSEFNITDGEILDAIRYHTTGRKGMAPLEKIIFIADYTESSRDFPGVGKVRSILEQSLDMAVLYAMENTLEYLISKKQLIHPDTIDAVNSFYLDKA
jgi:predicted HD superfamily hydrolase involved in NAD metabolism